MNTNLRALCTVNLGSRLGYGACFIIIIFFLRGAVFNASNSLLKTRFYSHHVQPTEQPRKVPPFYMLHRTMDDMNENQLQRANHTSLGFRRDLHRYYIQTGKQTITQTDKRLDKLKN